jgi:hypothetical protein
MKVLHLQRDSYHFKSSNPVRIVFAHDGAYESGVMFVQTEIYGFFRLHALFLLPKNWSGG